MTSWRYLALPATFAILGCSASDEPRQSSGEVEPTASALSGLGPTGVVAGRVLLEGTEIPQVTQIENTTDPDHCGRVHSLEDIVVSPTSRGIRNAVVALVDIPLPDGYELPTSSLVLNNQDCRFEPHVSVLTVGSTIEAVNSDPFYHSVHLYGLKQLNVSLNTSLSRLIELPNRPGYLIVKCDVHGWMQAYVRVDRHPFHAVTDVDGAFRISGVPAGTHGMEIWHEQLGPLEKSVSVEPNTVSEVTISYASRTEREDK